MRDVNSGRHRILYVVGQLGCGGLERQLWYLLRGMDREMFRPAVAVWNFNPKDLFVDRIRALGVPVIGLDRRLGLWSAARDLRRLVREAEPEVLHSYSFHTNFPAWWAMRGTGGVALGALRGGYWEARYSAGWWRAALSSRFPEVIVANSRAAQRTAEIHRSVSAPRRVEFVTNGVDTEEYVPAPLPAASRFEIVGIGRLDRGKRWEHLLEALVQFGCAAGSAWRCRIAGSGPLFGALQAQRDQLGLAERVEFLGQREDVAALLSSAHVCVLTSSFEGTPNVVLEAMAAGRPVVSTAVGDVPEIVRDGTDGFVVPAGDRAVLAKRILFLAKDRGALEQMALSARRRVEERHSISALVQDTLNAYRSAGWPEGGGRR